MNTNEKIAVFMDHSKARYILCEKGVARFSDTVESGSVNHVRYSRESSKQTRFGSDPYYGPNNEYSQNNQQKELKRVYFQKLKELLKIHD